MFAAYRPHHWPAWRCKRLLEACAENHTCGRISSLNIPTRLLDISLPGDIVKLVTSVNDQKVQDMKLSERGVRYVALSYCWGSYLNFATTPTSYKNRCEGFSIKEMPPTLRDSVQVARDLGCSHLWIDALCILQGDCREARQDWERESARMDSVYGNAYFTIVAGSAPDCGGGLFKPQTRFRLPFIHEENEQGQNERKTAEIFLLQPEMSFKDLPINSRGWALQEWLLSSRLLTFSTDHLHFYCTSMSKERGESTVVRWTPTSSTEEQLPIGHLVLKYRLPLQEEFAPPSHWFIIVMSYCCRNLTNPRDKLPAIAGLARRWDLLTKHSGGEYLAGLWRNHLVPGLLWRRDEGFHSLMWGEADDGYHDDRAPSWSWASIDGNVRWQSTSLSGDETYVAQIMDCKMTLATADRFGMVKEGRLVIRGPATAAYLDQHDTHTLYSTSAGMNDPLGTIIADIWFDDWASFGEMQSKGKGLVYCLSLCRSSEGQVGLVLQEEDKSQCFRRIGFFENRHSPDAHKDLSRESDREFVIV